jgi:hypothetical protein
MFDDFTHWPFVVAALIFASIGQTLKRTVLTWERIGDGRGWKRRMLWWGRKTLPLHPVLCGALLGLVPGIPTSQSVPVTTAASCLYYAGAGVVSTWIFDLLRGLLKTRGVELSLNVMPSSAPPSTSASSPPPGAG